MPNKPSKNNVLPVSPLMPGYQRDATNPSITRNVVSRIGARVSPSLPHDRRVVRAMVPQW